MDLRIIGSNKNAGLLRSYSGSIFSYYGYGWYRHTTNYAGTTSYAKPAYYGNKHYSRSVIVSGEGV